MKRTILFYIILVLTFVLVNFLFKYYHLIGQTETFFYSLSILVVILLLPIIFGKKKIKKFILGLATITISCILTGFIFWLLNWSPTFLYPSNYYYRDSFQVNYEPYNWEIAIADQVGINSIKLDSVLNKANDLDFLNSILIVKNNKLILEKYYKGDQYYAWDLQSATKTITSFLVGAAIQNSFIKDENQKIKDLLPKYFTNVTDKDEITIEHLLKMRSGLILVKRFSKGFDWIRNIINYPVTYKPDEKFLYSEQTDMHLLSGIISKSANMSTIEFANKYLFNPIGVQIKYWKKSPLGINQGACFLYMTPRDMARFGQLILNNGQLDGKQILPLDWTEKALRIYSKSEDTQHIFKVPINEMPGEYYGYGIWIKRYKDNYLYQAVGRFTQIIMIIPHLDMVIVTTGDKNTEEEEQSYLKLREILFGIIDITKT